MQEFIDILKEYGVNEVIDIRTIPRSRHNPQFNEKDLAHVLRNHHIGYRHEKDLGGLRHAHADSINTAWRNASFRGFADYMQTPEFVRALENLFELAQHKTIVLTCAEAVPWRCHRSLIADALSARGVSVTHILSKTLAKPHVFTPWAVVHDGFVTYPAQ